METFRLIHSYTKKIVAMNKQRPFFFTIKIRKCSCCFLSAGILLLFVLPPSVAQMSQQDWDERNRRQEEEEWYWHDRMMQQREQERQQQPVLSAQERAKMCSDILSRGFYKSRAYKQNLLGGLISAYCTALSRGDLNTAWINVKRMSAIFDAKNDLAEGGVKSFLDIAATNMIKDFGWAPPEYR
jgi:hypothetical protein